MITYKSSARCSQFRSCSKAFWIPLCPRSMAGVEALVGGVAATRELVGQCFCFASLLIDLRAKMKVGPQSAHEQAHYHEQLIEFLSKIQEDASGRQMKDPF